MDFSNMDLYIIFQDFFRIIYLFIERVLFLLESV